MDVGDIEYQRRELLDAIKSLAALIEHSRDANEIVRYAMQLNGFTTRLIALRLPPSKTKTKRRKPGTSKRRFKP